MTFDMITSLSLLSNYGIIVTPDSYSLNSTKTVIVGMSGGVDSSVSALLLRLMGYRVIGIYMKNWHTCNPLDYDDVRSVADALDINYYSINLTDDYSSKVFDAFLADLNAGLTPNPDVLCNKYIKFSVFLKYAKMLGADFIATGHYAKMIQSTNGSALARPLDLTKDQTYFLHDIDPACYSSVIFPLADLLKSTVRQIATDFNLPVATKKDSTGICFIDNKDYRIFISDYIAKTKGNFIDQYGNILGRHDGLAFYTVGQRRGLNLSFTSNTALTRLYAGRSLIVTAKSFRDNSILLVPDGDPMLTTKTIMIKNKNSSFTGRCLVRSSNLGVLVDAYVNQDNVHFDIDHKLVAPGQYLVFYNDSGMVLGGAIAS